MNRIVRLKPRSISIIGFSFLFAFVLSFQFEGQVLYSMLSGAELDTARYVLAGILSHFFGLFTGGWLVRSQINAKRAMVSAMGICLVGIAPFFFSSTVLWLIGLIINGYFSGCAVAMWGFFLKAFTPKTERLKSAADVLIFSNLLMIAINVVAMNRSPLFGLALAILCLVVAMVFIQQMPKARKDHSEVTGERRLEGNIKRSLMWLCLFIVVITINSGLMYEVINPSFAHLTKLVSWYWAVPYIAALIVVRNLPIKIKRSKSLYVAMTMVVLSFLGFMLLGRNVLDYLIIDTLLLGAFGIFDLFWWSILGEMLDHTNQAGKLFGIGLSANVFGVLSGGVLGITIRSIQLSGAEIAVIALTVVFITLILLPPLNRRLVMLLKSHTYLEAYDNMNPVQQTEVIRQIQALAPLTQREEEVLQLILSGKSNRRISEELYISENTVKTHVKNIYSKYGVSGRAELISTLLKNQTENSA
ncbi:MAG TPA: helix-turn-helix transcriptional regulator [Eubacteriaceae bacterium]|nr:helix-turn-helix transcriptional regulator [Eubacteriaceae bacterium]